MAEDNPFAKESTLAHGFPDFANIEESDYAPAFEEGIKQKREDIDAIKHAYRELFESGKPLQDVARELFENDNNKYVKEFKIKIKIYSGVSFSVPIP